MDRSKFTELTITFGFAILACLIPWGWSMPVTPKWICWAISVLCVLVVVDILIPSLAKQGTVRLIVLNTVILGILLFFLWPTILSQWKEEKSFVLSGTLVVESDGKDHSSEFPVLQIGDGGNTLT